MLPERLSLLLTTKVLGGVLLSGMSEGGKEGLSLRNLNCPPLSGGKEKG